MPRLAFSLCLLLLGAAFAGCLGPEAEPAAVAEAEVEEPFVARAVIALVDTGINPYHAEFRDDTPEGMRHPSEYLQGFPVDAPALDLTLDAEDYEAAVLADCDVWNGVEAGRMYWIPGTRIVGAITFSASSDSWSCDSDDLPGRILDRGSHGTMVASRAAGETYSLCPACKLVVVQGFSSASMKWVADQGWIDVQSNSWGALPTGYVMSAGDREEALAAAAAHPVFVAGGNGLLGFFGVTGHPAYLDNIAGPDGVVMVGGHDGGRFTPWTMTMPHVVADAMMHPAAFHNSTHEGSERKGGGTSGATPFAAGTFARVLLEARALVGDAGTGVRGGALVLAADDAALPETGPLDDGVLTVEEAKTLFFHTANPRPVRDGERDGPTCEPTSGSLSCILYPTLPIEWGVIPEALPMYYFVGYGQVGAVTLDGTLAALRGETPIPERPSEDMFFGFDTTLRRAVDA